MSITLLFTFLFMTAFAQENCDPLELEKECFNQLCTVPKNNLIFENPETLRREAAKGNFVLPKGVASDLERIDKLVKKIQINVRKSVSDEDLKDLTSHILEFPSSGSSFIGEFFSDSFTCPGGSEKCELIVNDMDPYGKKLKELYQKLLDYTEIKEGSSLLVKEQQRNSLLKALEIVSHLHSKEFIKKQKSLIASDKFEPHEFPWMKDVDDLMRKDLARYAPLVLSSIRQRKDELLEREYSKKDITESCRVNGFLSKELNKAAKPSEFLKLTNEASEGLKKNILSRLSSHSRLTMEKSLRPELFSFIAQEDQNIAPHYKNHIALLEQYQTSKDSMQSLKTLTKLPKQENLECNLGGVSANDFFRFKDEDMRIHVSLYSVANKATEAITHELGHWLSVMIDRKALSAESSKKVTQARECVGSFYGFEGETTEEDFADWVSSQVNYKRELHCDLERIMRTVRSPSASSYLPMTENYSGKLFRELNIRINRGLKAPSKCQELIDAHSEFAPKKCELK